MAEVSLMASAAYSPSPFFQEQITYRPSKVVSTTFLCHGNRRDFLTSFCQPVCSPPVLERWLPMNLFPTDNLHQGSVAMVKKPVLINEQDACADSLCSFEIAEYCASREKIQKFLFSGINEENIIDTSLRSDLMGKNTVAIDFFDMFSLYKFGEHDADHILHLARKFHIPKPLMEFNKDSSYSSSISIHPRGPILLQGIELEIKDQFSVAVEFNLLKSFTTSTRQSMVIPYFTRSRGGHARTSSQGSILSNQVDTSSKSPEKSKPKPSPKKKGKGASRERELYEKNYFFACENLLSLVIDKRRMSMAVLSLKKSGPEITQFLSKFAAGIAGTGLAILFSVACKSANGRVSLNAAKVLNAGLGIGLFCLSSSVTGLRDTVAYISRSTNKLKLTEEEMLARMDRSLNAILYRAAILVAIALLRFA